MLSATCALRHSPPRVNLCPRTIDRLERFPLAAFRMDQYGSNTRTVKGSVRFSSVGVGVQTQTNQMTFDILCPPALHSTAAAAYLLIRLAHKAILALASD